MRGFALAVFLLLPGLAAAQSADIDAGAQVAQRWCAGCHQISDRAPAKDTVPGFPEIARRKSTDERSLLAFLRKPHGQMPDFALSEPNIRLLTAYILSFK